MSSSVRFIHCSGFRFDSRSWEGLASWTAMRNQDLWLAFEEILTLCRNEKADFLFLTGDLFEQEYVRKETVERVARSLSTLQNTKVFISPGECDPLVNTTAYRFCEWPDNVHIFPGGISQVEIPEKRVTVYGAGWTTYRQQKPFLDDFTVNTMLKETLIKAPENTEEISFMLLYAEVESDNNTEGFIPVSQEQIAFSGLTYLALGHQETWSGLQQAENTYWADCGTVMARGFRESHPHGFIIGETDGQLTNIRFKELKQRRYIKLDLDLDSGEAESLVAGLLDATAEKDRKHDLFRLAMNGDSEDTEETVRKIQKLLAEKFTYLEIIPPEGIRISHNEPDDISDSTIEGRTESIPVVNRLLLREISKRSAGIKNDEERRHWELVRKIGLAALGQSKGNSEDKSEEDEEVGKSLKPEKLILAQALNSLSRAKSRVEEQAGRIEQIKSEYIALKKDWDAANRLEEEKRALQIELKNLHTRKKLTTEKLSILTKTQERIAVLRQNPDYRELRRNQAEVSRLEDLRRKTETDLITFTSDPQVDMSMINKLREECRIWAELQAETEKLSAEIRQQDEIINEMQHALNLSGYQAITENEEQHLRQAEEEWLTAELKLNELDSLDILIESAKKDLWEENAKLKQFGNQAELEAAYKNKMIQAVKLFTKRQSSRLNGYLDRMLQKQLARQKSNTRLTAGLIRYCRQHKADEFNEFQQQLKRYIQLKQNIKNLENKLAQLHRDAELQKELIKIVNTRSQLLRHAYQIVGADDYSSWLIGLEEYRQQEKRINILINDLNQKKQLLETQEKALAAYIDEVREKLRDWILPTADLEEILAVVKTVAFLLRAKEEAEKEYLSLKASYDKQLKNRNMDQLATVLEPLADLEREAHLPEKERQKELSTCRNELAEINMEVTKAEKRLQEIRKYTIKPDLDKKLKSLKMQWQNHDELKRALDTTEDILVAVRKHKKFS